MKKIRKIRILDLCTAVPLNGPCAQMDTWPVHSRVRVHGSCNGRVRGRVCGHVTRRVRRGGRVRAVYTAV